MHRITDSEKQCMFCWLNSTLIYGFGGPYDYGVAFGECYVVLWLPVPYISDRPELARYGAGISPLRSQRVLGSVDSFLSAYKEMVG